MKHLIPILIATLLMAACKDSSKVSKAIPAAKQPAAVFSRESNFKFSVPEPVSRDTNSPLEGGIWQGSTTEGNFLASIDFQVDPATRRVIRVHGIFGPADYGRGLSGSWNHEDSEIPIAEDGSFESRDKKNTFIKGRFITGSFATGTISLDSNFCYVTGINMPSQWKTAPRKSQP